MSSPHSLVFYTKITGTNPIVTQIIQSGERRDGWPYIFLSNGTNVKRKIKQNFNY